MSTRYDSRKDRSTKPRSKSKSTSSSPSFRKNKYKSGGGYKRPDYNNKYTSYNRYDRDRGNYKDYRYNNTADTRPPRETDMSKNQPQQPEINTFVLVASNISRNVTRKHLMEIFGAYGSLKGVYVPRDQDSKLTKGYVYLEYVNKEDAENAYWYMNGGQLDGLIVKIEQLNAKKEGQPQEKKKRYRSRSRRRSDSKNKKRESKPKYDKNKRKESSSSESSESSSEDSSSSRSSS
jgi:RNA recognition motif-containing protein